nr:immunoglobulin heavy chain junction region [Macaca mulatta]MOX59197.1 immunoglobulin heavy chain junction region [Macaca mulatta]MOX59713.1 immunoglobulin heavy chain junction region [Macaca mulatta]MOX60012.1 immunoglobulin heavy chain junction region [Macaca mulatta]MOX61092.1 immunoglobulin heavy chain junction region [Macaca mulatta]
CARYDQWDDYLYYFDYW